MRFNVSLVEILNSATKLKIAKILKPGDVGLSDNSLFDDFLKIFFEGKFLISPKNY